VKYILIRDVTVNECSWLGQTYKKGDIVYSYGGATYGCISREGWAFTLIEDKTPFFELPTNAVKRYEPEES